MKQYKIGYIFLVCSILNLSSCTKNFMTSTTKGRLKANYDAAAFNEVYVEGIKQKLLGNGGDALKYLEQCIKINPESDAAYFQMAQIVVANGDLKDGKQYLAKALSIDEENMWYLTMLAGLYYQEKILTAQ
jgi:tetratricopeptide (TPR) repeat protein